MNQDAEIAEFARRQVDTEGLDQGRAFTGHGADGVGVEKAEDAPEYRGDVETVDGVGAEELSEFGRGASAKVGWTRGRTPWCFASFSNFYQSTLLTGAAHSRVTRKHHSNRWKAALVLQAAGRLSLICCELTAGTHALAWLCNSIPAMNAFQDTAEG